MSSRVAILGSGLIGGSFALALRAAGHVHEVVVFDRDPDVARRTCAVGIADRYETDAARAVDGADLVVLAAPVGASATLFAAIRDALADDAIVTDVGSTKRDVIAAARRVFGPDVGRFVPGHPIAGRERHGPEAALADLFRGRRVLLTPIAENAEGAIDRVRHAWEACGATVTLLDAEAHDVALSSVSHLPHLLAFALVAQIADAPDTELKLALAGGGFRDFTRIAASSPAMWRDIALANRAALLDDLDAYRANLDRLRRSIDEGDGAALEALFARASDARRRLVD